MERLQGDTPFLEEKKELEGWPQDMLGRMSQ
jgi:hypothetical protein